MTTSPRSRSTRVAARVVLLNPDDRVLLLRDSDPGLAPDHPRATWWVTPGGGLEGDETPARAAVRELAEETGLVLGKDELIGPVATRVVVHGFTDQVTEQAETFFFARVEEFTPVTDGWTDDERLTLSESRWWSRAELAATDEWVWPRQLEAMIVAGLTGAPPLDLGTVLDESTVAPD